MLAAIEIYNKPRVDYREECCVILLLNAWELLLKGLLSKDGQSVFYPKKRKEPYRTLTWRDALARAGTLLPKVVHLLPVQRNLELLSTYRDNAIHFYNKQGFGVVLYALAQTCIVNFKDTLESVFGLDLGADITWQLLPLGLKAPIDPIEYLSGKPGGDTKTSSAIRQFLGELQTAAREVEAAGSDTGRLLTVFVVRLESTKKIANADVVVGVTKADQTPGPLAVVKTVDPNISHPLKQTDIVGKIQNVHGRKFTTHVFQALVWKYHLKDQPQYCWQAREGYLTRYSNDTIAWIERLSAADIDAAMTDYAAHTKRAKSTRNSKPN